MKPLYYCLKALEQGSSDARGRISKKQSEAYKEAINLCTKANLLHLQALMMEHYGRLLRLEEQNHSLTNQHTNNKNNKQHEATVNGTSSPLGGTTVGVGSSSAACEYLSSAMWAWYDWGANAKVELLKLEFPFLQHKSRGGRRSSSALLQSLMLRNTTTRQDDVIPLVDVEEAVSAL